jgi:DtxR family Mn-dependent transcriptional regulator
VTTASSLSSDASCCAIDQSPTVEDYLKTIFALTAKELPASTSSIAARLQVTPPSASTMMTRLREAGLVEQTGWGQVRLSGHGMAHARSVVRRHRLLETFLHQVLGMEWDEVHVEAEVLEHHLSRRVEELIEAYLDFPDRDPHGDPIPRLVGAHHEHRETPLAQGEPGDTFLVQRVYDSDNEVLRQLAHLDIRPGVTLRIDRPAMGKEPMWVRREDRRCHLTCAMIDSIHGRIISGDVPR